MRADASVTIAARGDVALTGDVLVTGNEAVSVSAETGGIRLDGAVTIGDETVDEASADVTLTAKGDIVQTVTSGDGGVRAQALTATSDEGAVRLGAGRDETVGSEGNAFSSAEVESAGDVILEINRQKINGIADWERMVNEKTKNFGFLVSRGGQTLFISSGDGE